MVLLPIVAFTISHGLGLTGEMAVGLMILACCPGGVTSNIITRISGGDTALSISYSSSQFSFSTDITNHCWDVHVSFHGI